MPIETKIDPSYESISVNSNTINTRSYILVVIAIIGIMSIVFYILEMYYSPSNISSTNTITALSSLSQNSVLLSFKIGEHPGARGTYIEVKDGKKVIISKVYTKGSRLEFYNDKSLIVTNSDSSQKIFLLNNDTIDLEVANSFTQVFHGEKTIKGLHKFKYNYTKNEILK